MFQLVDPLDERAVSSGIGAPEQSLSLQSMSAGGVVAGKVDDNLPIWDVETHFYNTSGSANFGYFARLFNGSGKLAKFGVVQDAKKYRLEDVSGEPTKQIGVAVRLSVACSRKNVEFSLTVANLAAAAQLGQADTRIGIYVLGYSGPLGDVIPAPADLNVENFHNFMAAFDAIQKRVFDSNSSQFYVPQLLGTRTRDESGG